MPKQWYIYEEDVKAGEEAYYGPFPQEEMKRRLNDPYADFMAGCYSNVDAIQMTDNQAKKIYINPPESWDKWLDEHHKNST